MALVRGVLASLASLALLTACSGDGGGLRSLADPPPSASAATEAAPAPTPTHEPTDWTTEDQADAMLVTAVSLYWDDYVDEEWRRGVCDARRSVGATSVILALIEASRDVPEMEVVDWSAPETTQTVIEMLDARC